MMKRDLKKVLAVSGAAVLVGLTGLGSTAAMAQPIDHCYFLAIPFDCNQ